MNSLRIDEATRHGAECLLVSPVLDSERLRFGWHDADTFVDLGDEASKRRQLRCADTRATKKHDFASEHAVHKIVRKRGAVVRESECQFSYSLFLIIVDAPRGPSTASKAVVLLSIRI
ncbi:hypothetical protein APZ15_37710 (plasmid) [Burkholderia cepacia ATCC 25416]|nr:hypothetical protein APZ15_37710 [Burkholderia cepacia ATCC 25416]